jgi:hypothetical protein
MTTRGYQVYQGIGLWYTDGLPVSLSDPATGNEASIGPRVQTPTGNVIQVQIGPGDVISNMPVVIEYDHHQIHEGESFEYCWYQSNLNGTRNFRFSVPDVPATINTPHIVAEVISNSTLTLLYWYEGTAWTTGGNDDNARAYNRNRNSLTTSTMIVYTSGTLALNPTTLGANFWQGVLFAGKNAAAVSESRSASEWVLKSNTEYMFRVVTADASNVMVRFLWYEDRGV